MHQIRKQANSSLPSGGTPTLFFSAPDNYNGQSAYIKVPKDTVEELRGQISVARDEAFRWVDDGFQNEADIVWDGLGRPEITAVSAWDVFAEMAELLRQPYL